MIKEFIPEGFSRTIFQERYAITPEETWSEACRRIARQMALAEAPEKQKTYEDKFYSVLVANLFVPGGRIWYGSGKNNPSLLNCFVLKSEGLDSKEGWGDLAYEMIVTSMSGGGCGIEFSDIRPNGALISTNKGICPGPVGAMDLIDGCAEPIRAGGSRRVALMFSLDLDHPDVEQFLDAKLVKGRLTHANVSVRSKRTDEFIKAIKKNLEWELNWKGQYKSTISARALWNKIVENAWKTAEPGFLNWELVGSENTIWYLGDLVTTNPCGEVTMQSYENCCLGHLVLHRFVTEEGKVDYATLGETIRSAVRFLDNVLTVNHFPIQEMKNKADQLRRIGLGVTGLADMLALTGLRYGSEEANYFIDHLFRFISKQAYDASIYLAVEKGPFSSCNREKHIEGGYVKRMTTKIKNLIREHGIRNAAILTAAPTGTVSILSGNCSSGVEPVFAPAYERRYWVGSERRTELVFHPLFKQLAESGKDVSHLIAAQELTVKEHLEVQKIIQRHLDQSISKTINLPEDYSVEDMSDVWLSYLPYLKGTTFYRANTRGYVDEQGEVHEPPLKALSLEEAQKRLKEISSEGGLEMVHCVSGVCSI